MKIALITLIIIGALVVGFIAWRLRSVSRGAAERDEKLIARVDPLKKRIEAGETVTLQEVAVLAARPENRFVLFAMLRHMKRSDLLPGNYSSSAAQGESALAYWLMHPNELQEAPAAIELVETIKKPIDGREAELHVYRYRMPEGHWAAQNGWMLGVAGPMPKAGEPYSEMPGAFARGESDLEGKVQPAELVDWYVDMLRQKGVFR